MTSIGVSYIAQTYSELVEPTKQTFRVASRVVDPAPDLAVQERPAFWSEAACLGVGNGVFYPLGPVGIPAGHVNRFDPYKEARAICQGCPVQAECLAQTLAEEAEQGGGCHGYRGGQTPDQRKKLLSWLRALDVVPSHSFHGTISGYKHHKCRCAARTKANAMYVAAKRAS